MIDSNSVRFFLSWVDTGLTITRSAPSSMSSMCSRTITPTRIMALGGGVYNCFLMDQVQKHTGLHEIGQPLHAFDAKEITSNTDMEINLYDVT